MAHCNELEKVMYCRSQLVYILHAVEKHTIPKMSKLIFNMKNNRDEHEVTESALQLKALRMLSEDKIQAIKHNEKHLNKVVCIYNTINLLTAVERKNRMRRNTDSIAKQQNEIPPKRPRLDGAAPEEKDEYKEEVDAIFNDLLTPPSKL